MSEVAAKAPHEVSRRRTFAIISHPDAGKTTLTEKLLLYGGAVQLAGSVTARKNQRATTSDWMELEKQRGISVSSTVLQFEYKDCVVNLLDTPGHKDFSEDTYRVLTAVDAAVMVIDAGKGIESQTLKLFEVCRRRGVPIFTFMNKLDRPARPPLELLDELERVLGIAACPMNWPLGDGVDFKGVFDRESNQVHLFERTVGGKFRAPVNVKGIEDDSVRDALPPLVYQRVCDELDLLEGGGSPFDFDQVRKGQLSPVFYGSAMNNFGVQMMLDGFLKIAPPPAPRMSGDQFIEPASPNFSGFVFKIQANMNPKHRDRVAFIRIVSGCFQRDMSATNTRTGTRMRLGNSQRLFAQERETVNEAWAGDVVGLVGNYDLQIGDTLSEEAGIKFDEMPTFPPECFAYLHNENTSKFKRFREGLDQLLKEGVAQPFELPDAAVRVPLLGAVGPLQFDVLKYRLESEYNAEVRLEFAPWSLVRWIKEKNPEDAPKPVRGQVGPSRPNLVASYDTTLAQDVHGNWVALFGDKVSLGYFESKNAEKFHISPFPVS
ncbi:peptide chain release factor 3 [Prosthecobacter debontii]|uniref:Peptide chain release factor 3 n=1 Tax=Prosthecobacter debontii TaxID=48467 RepID=A0A1T4WE12_9BACT|nr:peptide chain release factor 3 [Prosthecobacter debontii]SKA75427.1 peptide chain release factor 3 [Prosthecobacter debontii]